MRTRLKSLTSIHDQPIWQIKLIFKVYLTMIHPLECLTIKYQLSKRMQSNNTFFSLLVKIQENIAALEDREQFLTKLRLILYMPVIVLIDIYQLTSKSYAHMQIFTSSLFIIAKIGINQISVSNQKDKQ